MAVGLHWRAVAPPKRKTGGRVTPAGTTPTSKRSGSTPTGTASAAAGYDSGRYTAPTARYDHGSPSWVPVLMLTLFIGGALLIIARYLFWDSNIPMIIGMVALLGGLYTATKWR